VVEIRPVRAQVDDLLSEIRLRAQVNERVLVTTLTKRMAEDLTEYLNEHGVKVRYLHSDIETVERSEIIRDLRLGKFDVIVGINLLREVSTCRRYPWSRSSMPTRRISALRGFADPNHRPGGAPHPRQGDSVCGRANRIDRARHRGDRSAPQQADRIQCRARITPRTIVKAVGDVMEGARSVRRATRGMQAPITR